MPGIGPVCAMAITTFAPDMCEFRRARDIRRLLIVGAMSVVHWRGCEGGRPGTCLSRMLAWKPRMLVAIALANKMARMLWAMLTRNEDYRDPTGVVC